MSNLTNLGYNISIIDLFDLNLEHRTGSYILQEKELTIIETSASPSVPYLLKGLEKLKIDPQDVKYIIVTHVHLDHAGGVGLLLESCPDAKVIVHPKGKRHLADPSKLILGAKAVYGNTFDEWFNPIKPVPSERLVTKHDGDTLKIGENRTLTFLDTPGHAKHHLSIYDSYSNGIFTGDTIGVYYPQIKEFGFEFVLPSTSPNHFDPKAMINSLERVKGLGVDRIYFGHYGKTEQPEIVYESIQYFLPLFVSTGEKILSEYPNEAFDKQIELLEKELLDSITKYLANKNVPDNGDIYNHINVDIPICAMGIMDYLVRNR